MDNITVILPIHRLNENEKDYFANAVKSVVSQKTETPAKLFRSPPLLGEHTEEILKKFK